MKIIFSSLLVLIVVGLYHIHSVDKSLLVEVKSGALTLECHIGDDYKVINPDLVTNFSDGRWFFTNGSATQCFTN